MARVTIRKVAGRWTSSTPGIGFGSTAKVHHHDSHRDAIRAHTGRGGLASTGCTTDLSYPPMDVLSTRAEWLQALPWSCEHRPS